MRLVEINWEPTDRQLRQFGWICLVALPSLAWLWRGGPAAIGTWGAIGGVLAFLGMGSPQLLKPVYLALSIVTTPLGMVFGELSMLLIYFGVFLPLALAARVVKRDALQVKLDRNRKSFWQPKRQPTDIKSYYRQS